MSLRSRRKGKQGEREAAALLRSLGFDGCRRGQQFAGGQDSPDVVGISGLHLEIKRVEALNIHAAMRQSISESAWDEVPVVLHRRNRGEWLITLPATELHAFCAAVARAREGSE